MSMRREWLVPLVVAGAAVILIVCVPSAIAGDRHVGKSRAVVSLTFDDGFATQLTAARLLSRYGMRGTFYVSSGMLDESGRLTVDDLRALKSQGDEIGGHTHDHVRLTAVDHKEAVRQICDDRVIIARLAGEAPRSFAYPYGAYSPLTERDVRECGYTSARTVGGLRGEDCSSCPPTESISAHGSFAVRTGLSFGPTTSFAGAREQVERAMRRGGWLVFVFHQVCDDCSDIAVSPATLRALLRYLRAQEARGLEIRTVGDVIGGTPRPLVRGPRERHPPDTLVNGSLEEPARSEGHGATAAETWSSRGAEVSDLREASHCWTRSGYGANRATWRRVSPGRTGEWAEQVSVASFATGDRKLLTRMDLGSCSPRVRGSRAYRLSAWYRGTSSVHIVAFYESPGGHWVFLRRSPSAPPSGDWRRVAWTTPPLPTGAQRLSFGVEVTSTGTTTIDDLAIALHRDRTPLSAIILGGVVVALAAAAGLLLAVQWRRRAAR